MDPITQALRFEEALLPNLPHREFTAGDAATVTGHTEGAIGPALQRMARDGLLTFERVKGCAIYKRKARP